SLVLGLAGGARAQDVEPSSSPAERSDELRLRYGASLGTGFGVADSRGSFVFPIDAHGRIGAQLNDWFAIYYQATIRSAIEVRVCVLCSGQSAVDLVHTSAA